MATLTKRARRRARKQFAKRHRTASGMVAPLPEYHYRGLTKREERILKNQCEPLIEQGIIDLGMMSARCLELRRCGWAPEDDRFHDEYPRIIGWWDELSPNDRDGLLEDSRRCKAD